MTRLDPDRWAALWKRIGASGDPSPWYERLVAAYSEPHRHYHNQQHIAECLTMLDGAPPPADGREAVEMALWFHDAVYDPHAADNEERSAALATRCLEEACVPAGFAETVYRLVMATKTHEVGCDATAALVVDVDLSILGQPVERFLEYEAQIRQEYAWVPSILFRSKRARILSRFLARERIFVTDWFHQKFEAQARRNLELSIDRLKRWFG